MAKMEHRFITATTRKENAQGIYEPRHFNVVIPIEENFADMIYDIINQIRKKGYETQYIVANNLINPKN